MRFSTLPPLLVAMALVFGATTQYPGSASIALGAVGFVLVGAWLTLEIGTEILERWRRLARREEPRQEPPQSTGGGNG